MTVLLDSCVRVNSGVLEYYPGSYDIVGCVEMHAAQKFEDNM